MNDNDAPVKPWELAVLVVLSGLLVGLVVLSYICFEVR
jgi:hypothetical protein